MRAGASGCASSGVRLSLSTRSVGPVSPRNGGRVKGFDGVGGGGFGGFGEGVILIDPIPRSISLTAVLLSPSTAKMSLLVPSDAGRVKVDLGLVCGGGGGCVGIGVGVILIAHILSSIPSSSSPSFGVLTDRRERIGMLSWRHLQLLCGGWSYSGPPLRVPTPLPPDTFPILPTRPITICHR